MTKSKELADIAPPPPCRSQQICLSEMTELTRAGMPGHCPAPKMRRGTQSLRV